jgi:hypothetical protein
MAGTPTVSAVITAYNLERYLGRAIDSVFAQDYPADALEVIVVDDGSTDGTAQVAAAYGDRIRYIHQPNAGHLAAYDRGIGEATGDYIALLDGDDEWLPHKVSAQVALLQARPEVGLVHGDMRLVDGDGRVFEESLFADRGMTELEGDLLGVLMRRNMVTTTLMVRGSLRDRFHPIPSWGRAQDWWIALRVAEVAEIACLHEPVADYRRHGSNMNNGRKHRGDLLRRELPLRRWLLTNAAEDRLGGDDLSAALATFEKVVESASEALGISRRELVPADREAAERRLAQGRATDDPDEAARHFVATLAHDPWNAIARRELVAAGRRGGWIAAPAAAAPAATAVAVERPRIDGARSFVTLADAAELGARPELLAAYASVFSAADDATLVIRLGSDPEALAALEAAVAVAGLDGEDAADLLAVPAEGPAALSLAALAPSVDAVLSAALPDGPLAALPCAGADGVAALAALARGEGETWCINIGAPHWWSARTWGDLHYARAIQQELARRGRPCAIHVIDQWAQSRDERFDVVLHLKGLTAYDPNPAQINLLWSISHPEKLTTEECERFDAVLVASETFAGTLRERVSVPVAVLEQATDPDVFFPERDPAHARDLVFVGNSRKVVRRTLAALLPTEHDLAVWGGDWDGLIDTRHVVGTYLPNDEVRRAYSSAAIVLNDHWDDMREHGFASNRLYDAVACGAMVISDRLDGLEERFGGAVVTYGTADELRTIVDHFLAHPEERAARGAAGRALVLADHTFAQRVDALLEHAYALAARSSTNVSW